MRAFIISCLFLLASALASPPYRVSAVTKETHDYGIYGGTLVNITEVPFMALFRPKTWSVGCGATIVHEQFLVTAAHCVRKMEGEKRITVGTDKTTEGEDYEIEQMFVHPQYDMLISDYDIAVIKLKKKLTLSERVNIKQMADSSLIPSPGEDMMTLGFGMTEYGISASSLLKVNVPYVDRARCLEVYELYGLKITEHMTCAGGEYGKDSCGGDSGGALIYKDRLFGVVSFGSTSGCGAKGVPGVYANVPSMRDFIDNTIQNNM